MAGNVNEWVADDFDEGFYPNSPPSNPINKSGKAGRIYRGGSFDNANGEFFTTSRRYGNIRTFSEVDVGFRCAAPAQNARPDAALTAEFCSAYAEFRPGATCP
jgi:formylglycine-generating enzyme required for sulfatase activity